MAILPGLGPKGNLPRSMPDPTGAADRALRMRFYRGAFKYTFMPEIMPRVRRMGRMFGHFAHMLALIFRSARLLPAGHPMLSPSNIGAFGFTDVISAAANNLVFSRKNLDQILIFFAIIMAVVMIFIQIGIIAFYAAFSADTAQAQGMFTTADPNNDVVLTFLQQTIDLPGFFNSASPIGFSISAGIREMLKFYSTGLMIIATVIVVYYVIVVVGESAQSGTPFGRRFNGLWAPVRLVLALGLLVPLGNGLNAAQYTALAVAKAGSSFATQAWVKFTSKITSPENVVGLVMPGGLSALGKHIFMMEVCREAWNLMNTNTPERKISGVTVEPPGTLYSSTDWISHSFRVITGTSSRYMFHWKSDNSPFSCGSISQSIPTSEWASDDKALAKQTMQAYFDGIEKIIENVRPLAAKYAAYKINGTPVAASELDSVSQVINDAVVAADNIAYTTISTASKQFADQVATKIFGDGDKAAGGWGAAATFYMRIAYANQRVGNIVRSSLPSPTIYKAEDNVSYNEAGTLNALWGYWISGKVDKVAGLSVRQQELEDLSKAVKFAEERIAGSVYLHPSSIASAQQEMTKLKLGDSWGNGPVAKFIKHAFTVEQFNALVDPDQKHIFPMAKLAALGNGFLDRAFTAFQIGVVASLASTAIGNLIFMLGFIGLGIGFLLAYVLPFMPFIYFFFAIVEWGMGVLEAMIGAPLWALAHLRIEGDGIFGQTAMKGYEILLGILLRPFFILFGLLASYICFNSGANFLNMIYASAVGIQADGMGKLSMAGYIGYLIVYAIIVYNLGLVCFKMIDQIPNQALRWMGISDGTYKDGKQDPIGQVSQMALGAGAFVGGQLAGAASNVAGSSGGLIKGIAKGGWNKLGGKGKGGAGAG